MATTQHWRLLAHPAVRAATAATAAATATAAVAGLEEIPLSVPVLAVMEGPVARAD
ncbi:hypothetical protein [Mycobacterium camsae]|uniref:hypothetical protein n=1 Tax=Mycobacterium gordonae TaxID=1778 RepID=UPI001F11F7DD|nr:hypothetical protein [Mycobacterium gordonae]